MNLGPHANFILLAYAAAAFVLAALVIWVIADHRAQIQTIESLEAKGVSRRSRANPR